MVCIGDGEVRYCVVQCSAVRELEEYRHGRGFTSSTCVLSLHVNRSQINRLIG